MKLKISRKHMGFVKHLLSALRSLSLCLSLDSSGNGKSVCSFTMSSSGKAIMVNFSETRASAEYYAM